MGPAPVGDVGDRIVPGQIFVVLQTMVQDLKQPARFALIAIDGRLDLLREIAKEHIRLTHHRTDASDLEEQPLQNQALPLGIGRQQRARLLGQIDHDRPGFEHGEVVGVAVDDGGDAAVGIDRDVPWLLLLALRQGDRADLVGQPQLL